METIMKNIYDCTFKSIVLDSNLKEFICFIIHDITRISLNELIEGEFLNPYIPIKKIGDKVRESDIILSTKNHVINIEANKSYYPGLFKKNNSYYQEILSKMYKKGKNYNLAKKVIQLNFDNFSIPRVFPRKKISKYVLKEQTSNNEFIENDTLKYYIDLEILEKISRKNNFENLSRLDRYLLIFKLNKKNEIKKIIEEDENMKKVYKKIIMMNDDNDLIGVYDKEERDQMVLNTQLTNARMEGEKSGYTKGKKNGEKKGYDKGILETAKKMLLKKIDINLISETTGLSKSKIKTLM